MRKHISHMKIASEKTYVYDKYEYEDILHL